MTHELRGIEASPERYDLGEGVLWDDLAGLVRWVDINEGRVLAAKLDGDHLADIREVKLPETVGAVALAEDGGVLAAGGRRLVTISPDGEVSFGPDLLDGPGVRRFNDGGVDPQGRFVVGSAPLAVEPNQEVMLRVSADGTVETLRTGLGLSNGIGWSPDGTTIYHIDSPAYSLSSHSYGPGEFDTDEPWVPIPIEYPTHPNGIRVAQADGLRVDSEGMLWIAMYPGYRAVRFAPDGRELSRVAVDAQQATCPGFVGPDLDRLLITSAYQDLSPEETVPADGRIFLVDPGVTGLPMHRWAGSTVTPAWAS
jgi:sugar lactone lactonase YvrE